MPHTTPRLGIGIAASLAGIGVTLALFLPLDDPWPGFWIAAGCAAAVWIVRSSLRPASSVRDVIDGLDAEPSAPPVSTRLPDSTSLHP